MGDTCRDSVAIALLPEEAREGHEATDSWWLQLFLCASTAQWHGRWSQGHPESLGGI